MGENVEYRIEHDTMGEVKVPKDALWRAQTQRAVENFPISGRPLAPELVHALAQIKASAAVVNAELGVLDAERAAAIVAAADQVTAGEYDAEFPIDVFQTGSGTSTNMNVNEVLATLATARRRGRAPERPRQRVAVEQRHLPVGDPRRRDGRRRPRAAAGARRTWWSRWGVRAPSSPRW